MEKFDTFISYNSKDFHIVEGIYRTLKIAGIKMFFDKKDIGLGDKNIEVLTNALEICNNFLIFIGQDNGHWQNEEIGIIIRKRINSSKNIGIKVKPIIIPILLPGIHEDTIPAFLQDYGCARFKTILDLDIIEEIVEKLKGSPGLTPVYSTDNGLTENNFRQPLGFKAHTAKIINLLIGESIYQNQDVAVRELIQNSVDACERRNLTLNRETPKIEINVHEDNSFFEIIDNGDGMSLENLKNNFIAIGKSINDEVTDSNSVNKLIGQFGIGFISTFMIADKISISTQFAGQSQINFDIISPTEKFNYFEQSQVNRIEGYVGTTIKLQIKEKCKSNPNFNLLRDVRLYCRHLSFLQVSLIKFDGRKESIELPTNDWNTQSAILKKLVSHQNGKYALHLGLNQGDIPLIASNCGFLINNQSNSILPYNFPGFVGGEINFESSAIKLNIARNEVIEDNLGKINDITEFITNALRILLLEYYNSFNSYNSYPAIRENIKNLLMYYLSLPPEEPNLPLSRIEIITMLESVWEIVYEGQLTTIKEVFIKLKSKGINRIYFFTHGYISQLQNTIKESMEKQGYIFIPINGIGISLKKGSKFGYANQVSVHNALNILALNQQYFELRDIQNLHESDFQPKEETHTPTIILDVLNELMSSFRILIKVCKLYDSKPFVLVGNTHYINFDDVFFQKLIRDVNKSKINKHEDISFLFENILGLDN